VRTALLYNISGREMASSGQRTEKAKIGDREKIEAFRRLRAWR